MIFLPQYVDHSVTSKACAGLNGMRLGGQVLTAVLATPEHVLVGYVTFALAHLIGFYICVEVSLVYSGAIVLLGKWSKSADLQGPRACKAPYQEAQNCFKAEECGINSYLCFGFLSCNYNSCFNYVT